MNFFYYVKTDAAILGLLLAATSGCSKSEAPPLELIGAAKMAVQDAERSDHTAQLAPVDLQRAERKLSLAEEALSEKDNRLARRLSEQAIVDAQLAKAKSLSIQSSATVSEEKQALDELKSEVNRTN